MSQLSDVVARRRDRTPQTDARAPSALDQVRPEKGQANAQLATTGPAAALAATLQQLADDAVTESAEHATALATWNPAAPAGDAVSGDLGAADTQVTLAADVLSDARQAVTMASAAFPAATAAAPSAPKPAATRTTLSTQQPQVTRGR